MPKYNQNAHPVVTKAALDKVCWPSEVLSGRVKYITQNVWSDIKYVVGWGYGYSLFFQYYTFEADSA